MNYKRFGDYIKLFAKHNKDLEVTNLTVINFTKNFMPSVGISNGKLLMINERSTNCINH